MAQVDNRNSSASKRARTDGGRREDDWTCTSCGNVNFSFRTSCNMRNCTQARPADHNSKFPAKPLQSPHRSYAAPYVGSGAPSSMYASVPPYGSPLFSGSSMPPYDVRYSGGSAYPYDYGGRISGGSPFRALHISAPAPPPYSGGAMMGNGIYGMPPMMDRYGMGMPVPPTGLPPRFGYFPDDRPQKKEVARENDWKCPKCGNVNFSFRTVCNMRSCDTPKPMSQPQGTKSDKNSKQKVPDGSWKCVQCNNINYPFRTKCNNQNCGADKPSDENAPSSEPTNENNQ